MTVLHVLLANTPRAKLCLLPIPPQLPGFESYRTQLSVHPIKCEESGHGDTSFYPALGEEDADISSLPARILHGETLSKNKKDEGSWQR